MNYSTFLQARPDIETILDRFDQDEQLHRFEILTAIAENSLFITPAIKQWARQSLEQLGVENVTSWVTIASLATLDPQIIPPRFFDAYEFLSACIKTDAVRSLLHLRTINRPSYTPNVERFRAQPLPITIHAWNAMDSKNPLR